MIKHIWQDPNDEPYEVDANNFDDCCRDFADSFWDYVYCPMCGRWIEYLKLVEEL